MNLLSKLLFDIRDNPVEMARFYAQKKTPAALSACLKFIGTDGARRAQFYDAVNNQHNGAVVKKPKAKRKDKPKPTEKPKVEDEAEIEFVSKTVSRINRNSSDPIKRVLGTLSAVKTAVDGAFEKNKNQRPWCVLNEDNVPELWTVPMGKELTQGPFHIEWPFRILSMFNQRIVSRVVWVKTITRHESPYAAKDGCAERVATLDHRVIGKRVIVAGKKHEVQCGRVKIVLHPEFAELEPHQIVATVKNYALELQNMSLRNAIRQWRADHQPIRNDWQPGSSTKLTEIWDHCLPRIGTERLKRRAAKRRSCSIE